MTTVSTKWIQPTSHIDVKLAVSYLQHTLITSCAGYTPTPLSLLLKLLIWNMLIRAVTIADSLWTFCFVTDRMKSQRFFCRKPSALLPPSAGPHFIWIINDKSFFFQATQRHFSFSCVLQFKEKMEPWRRIVVFRCKARPRVCRSWRPTEAAHRIYSAIQSWKMFFEAVQMIGFSLYFE